MYCPFRGFIDKIDSIERWQETGRQRGLTCSKGPQVRLKPWVAAARTKLVGPPLHHLINLKCMFDAVMSY